MFNILKIFYQSVININYIKLYNKVFNKPNIIKVIIIFTIGLISRIIIVNLYNINVFVQYFEYISLLYYCFISMFIVLVHSFFDYLYLDIDSTKYISKPNIPKVSYMKPHSESSNSNSSNTNSSIPKSRSYTIQNSKTIQNFKPIGSSNSNSNGNFLSSFISEDKKVKRPMTVPAEKMRATLGYDPNRLSTKARKEAYDSYRRWLKYKANPTQGFMNHSTWLSVVENKNLLPSIRNLPAQNSSYDLNNVKLPPILNGGNNTNIDNSNKNK